MKKRIFSLFLSFIILIGIYPQTSVITTFAATNWVSVAAGANFTVAVRADGTLWGWGDNQYGQLGDGTLVERYVPVQIGSDKNWSSVSVGGGHTLAIKTNRTLWAWGNNNCGQLGTGVTVNKYTPVQIGIDNTWKSVSAGSMHSLAIKENGTLWAWGNNGYGQLGDGTNTDKAAPVQVGTDINWKDVSAGGTHSMAIKTDDSLWGWGNNSLGAIGDGTYLDKNVPVQTSPVSEKWISVSAGLTHTVAITTAYGLHTWGDNTTGELGDGGTANKCAPGSIGLSSIWKDAAAGCHFTVGIQTDGTLWAWGNNYYGQIGDGSNVDKLLPTQIGVSTNWKSVHISGDHVLALKDNGELWAWGSNLKGELGNGMKVDSNAPVLISNASGCILTVGESLTYGDWNYVIVDITSDTGVHITKEVHITKYVGKIRNVSVPGMIDKMPVTVIRDSAFSNNKSLKSVTIPDGITRIGGHAFYNNSKLTRVILPSTLSVIERSAFFGCKKLTNIIIPSSVTLIDDNAFSYCTSLTNVYFEASTPPATVGTTPFGFAAPGARVIVPNGTSSNFGGGYMWNDLILKEESPFGIEYAAKSPDVILQGKSYPDGILPEPGFSINLTKEILRVPNNYTILSYSLDGGNRWKAVKADVLHDVNFPKLLNRGLHLAISDMPINPITRRPFDNNMGEVSNIYFEKIGKRPKTPTLTSNYYIKADPTGNTTGKWVLAERRAANKRLGEVEYPVGFNNAFTGSNIEIEIGLAAGMGGVVDTKSYGLMPPGGIPVLSYKEFDNRVKKTIYLIRTPPKAADANNNAVPGSRPKKLSILSEQKPTKYIVRNNKSVGKYIRLSKGTNGYPDGGVLPVAPGEYTFWKQATPTRPVSAKQVIVVPTT